MSQSSPRFSSPRFLSTFGFALFALSAGCTTGQIGGEIENTDGPREEGGDALAGSGCEAIETTAIEGDEETSIGISAQDVIDAIKGTHETTLSWAEEISGLDVSVSPEAGESTLVIEVTPREDSAMFVDLEVEQSDREDDRALIGDLGGEQCSDEIQIVADVHVSSENGAFDDAFEVTFHAKSAGVVSGSVEIVPGELDGSFDVSSEGNGEPVQTGLSLSFAFGTVSGAISGVWQEVHGDPSDGDSAVSGAWAVYGRFPAGGCQSGTLIGEDSPWYDAILDAVADNTEFDFSWQSGEPTTLTVEPTVGTLCLEVNQYEGGGTILGDVAAQVSTEDGRVDAVWDLELRAQIDGEEITSLTVRGVYDGFAAEDFASETGISGVETDATDLGFDFTYTIGRGGDATSGTLTILELDIPDCARPDYEPEVIETPDGGQGSAGCSGTDFTEIETATFITSESSTNE